MWFSQFISDMIATGFVEETAVAVSAAKEDEEKDVTAEIAEIAEGSCARTRAQLSFLCILHLCFSQRPQRSLR